MRVITEKGLENNLGKGVETRRGGIDQKVIGGILAKDERGFYIASAGKNKVLLRFRGHELVTIAKEHANGTPYLEHYHLKIHRLEDY